MLTTHLNTTPYTKLLVIEDTIQVKADNLVDYLLKTRTNNHQCYYLIFQRDFQRTQQQYPNVKCYDFCSDYDNWLNTCPNIDAIVTDLINKECVIFFDSLAHIIFKYGVGKTYRLFQQLKNSNHIHQIVTILHSDLLLENKDCIQQYFKYLSTFSIELQSINNDNNNNNNNSNKKHRLSYIYKKSARKIIKDIQMFWFENGRLIVEKIEKPATIQLVQDNEKLPENLSTFKISLTDKDRELRNNLVLPYLPKDEGEKSGGRIDYTFDDIDDWDEEDPDDDLDI